MLKESGIGSGWDDDMKVFLYGVISGFIIVMCFVITLTTNKYLEKTALEIKVLQHELKSYEEMDKELAE